MPDAEFRPPAPQPVGGPQDVTLQDPPLREGPWPGEDDATAGIRIAPRILLVEDDPLICIDMQCTLEELGYDVSGVAHHLGAAMGFLGRHAGAIDFAVVDVELAGETCIPLAGALDELGVPYLLVTGHDQATVRELGLAGRVLEKPFLARSLADHLTALQIPA